MADISKPMERMGVGWLCAYLLVSSALFLYLAIGLLRAAPPTTEPTDQATEATDGEETRRKPVNSEPNFSRDAAPTGASAGSTPDQNPVDGPGGTPPVSEGEAPRDPEADPDPSGTSDSEGEDPNEDPTNDPMGGGPVQKPTTGSAVNTASNATQSGSAGSTMVMWNLCCWKIPISHEVRLILLVTFIGAFGASVMALQSIADYRGRAKLTNEWFTFYIVRPPVGGGIAIVFYLVIRGGFLAGAEYDAGASTPYGILAVAALVGMFSDKAILKLNEVFLTLFKAEDDRGGKLSGPAIDTKALKDGKVSNTYDEKLSARGGKPPYQWSVTPALPAGLTLDPAQGTISGTPTAAAAKAAFTFTVTDADGNSAKATIDLTVAP